MNVSNPRLIVSPELLAHSFRHPGVKVSFWRYKIYFRPVHHQNFWRSLLGHYNHFLIGLRNSENGEVTKRLLRYYFTSLYICTGPISSRLHNGFYCRHFNLPTVDTRRFPGSCFRFFREPFNLYRGSIIRARFFLCFFSQQRRAAESNSRPVDCLSALYIDC